MLQAPVMMPRVERLPSVRAVRALLVAMEKSIDALPTYERARLFACVHTMLMQLRAAYDPRRDAEQRLQLQRGAFVELRRLEMRLVRLAALPPHSALERAIDRADMLLGNALD